MKEAKKKSKENKEKIKDNSERKENLGTRGRVFKGTVTRKFHKRVAIEFERMIYVRKYERYTSSKTRIHARLPDSMEKQINIGDIVRVQECRPLSKIIHFIVIEKIKDASENFTKIAQKLKSKKNKKKK
ncbi:MAG: 30S ribosomal protein S17 [Minisyncoccales bacterium]